MNGMQIRIRGKAQGMGFHPFVWQLAWRQARCGDVCNDDDGILVRLAGGDDGFTAALADHCPPLVCIDSTDCIPYYQTVTPQDLTTRRNGAGCMCTQIVPDIATCPTCFVEMNDPRARRYRYPFISCAHRRPRLIVIRAMPYDRLFIVMALLPLCFPCEVEFHDPADRRFHAQPVACLDCGPRLEWRAEGKTLNSEAALQAAITRLATGDIVTIKDIGDFHLACDTDNPTAAATPWAKKHRPAKPLAVMLLSATGLSVDAAVLMDSPVAPIVLITKAQVSGLCDEIAPGSAEVGVMLLSSPLQHLLLQTLARPTVTIPGNLSGRPPVLNNAQTLNDLTNIVDGFLLRNRDVLQQMNDSLVWSSSEILRHARGYVPDMPPLPPGLQDVPPPPALGADMKNTFYLACGSEAVLNQYFGDLGEENVEQQ